MTPITTPWHGGTLPNVWAGMETSLIEETSRRGSAVGQPCSVERSAHLRAGLRLEIFTVGWNMLEAVVAGVAGLRAGSIALIGFGLDAVIESFSGAVLLWRLRPSADNHETEQKALRLVGVSLILLAGWVGWNAVRTLIEQEPPDASTLGIALAILSGIVMPILARAKRRVARQLNSAALIADSRQTDICAYLSWILLGGLVCNAFWGWWWADPMAALLMLPIIVTDGLRALRGRTCCC